MQNILSTKIEDFGWSAWGAMSSEKLAPQIRNAYLGGWKLNSTRMTSSRWVVLPGQEREWLCNGFGTDLEIRWEGWWRSYQECCSWNCLDGGAVDGGESTLYGCTGLGDVVGGVVVEEANLHWRSLLGVPCRGTVDWIAVYTWGPPVWTRRLSSSVMTMGNPKSRRPM